MSRILKFRAWQRNAPYNDDSNGHMLKWEDTEQDFWYYLKYRGEFTVMQFTGLKDKNGVEIFEGDILKSKKGILYRTDFELGTFVANAIHSNKWPGYHFFCSISFNESEMEVIGNMHTNPELFK